eukprot:11203195-Lingulodinium_polyedra.AAC.1
MLRVGRGMRCDGCSLNARCIASEKAGARGAVVQADPHIAPSLALLLSFGNSGLEFVCAVAGLGAGSPT